MDVPPNCSSLQNMKKGCKELIQEYTLKWREVKAQVHPSLIEKQMIILYQIHSKHLTLST